METGASSGGGMWEHSTVQDDSFKVTDHSAGDPGQETRNPRPGTLTHRKEGEERNRVCL